MNLTIDFKFEDSILNRDYFFKKKNYSVSDMNISKLLNLESNFIKILLANYLIQFNPAHDINLIDNYYF